MEELREVRHGVFQEEMHANKIHTHTTCRGGQEEVYSAVMTFF